MVTDSCLWMRRYVEGKITYKKFLSRQHLFNEDGDYKQGVRQ